MARSYLPACLFVADKGGVARHKAMSTSRFTPFALGNTLPLAPSLLARGRLSSVSACEQALCQVARLREKSRGPTALCAAEAPW